jgi:dTDP-4-amino-4,6-dideoxygalactose transaminase
MKTTATFTGNPAPHVKFEMSDLAINGSDPAFSEPLHVGRPNVGSESQLLARIQDAVRRRWFSNNGPFVQEFEESLKARLGVRHCIPICNGTVALEITIRALGLHGEVIVPSFTFVATAHALQWQEITPVFCDVSKDSHNIDPGEIETLITPRTTGIIGVHVWGRPCNDAALLDVARRHGLTLIYDASHAIGCSAAGIPVGNLGRAEVFSFHATKFINSFEGGAIATNDDALSQKIRLMKNFGFSGYDNVVHIGTNGKMNEISAAMGLTSLESMDECIAANKNNFLTYQNELCDVPGIKLLPYDARERHNYQYVVAEVDERAAGLHRDELMAILHSEQILARRYFYPGCHKMEPYRSYFPHAGLLLPRTEQLVQRVLVLPTGATVSQDDILAVCGIIRTSLSHAPECRRLLLKRQQQYTGAVERQA